VNTNVHPLLTQYPLVYRVDVVWGEMDAFAHVNNVAYFRYFESARIAYGQAVGMMDWRETTGVGPIVAGASARYKRPVVFPDHLLVGVSVYKLADDRFWQRYCIVSQQQNAVTTEGEAEIVMFNYRDGKKTAIPEPLRTRITALEAQVAPS
jgi:acyl-CoA thioester hydrolase